MLTVWTRRAAAAIAISVACVISASAATADYELKFVLKGDTPSELIVFLGQPLPEETALKCASPVACKWSVEMLDSKLSRQQIQVTSADTPSTMKDFGQFQAIALTLATAIDPEAVRVTVTLLLGNAPSQVLRTRDAQSKAVLQPVDSPDEATLYFSGIVAPAVGKHTAYSIDARASWWISQQGLSSLSIAGEYKADARPNADPDTTSLFLIGDHYGKLISKWDVGVESDRSADVVNLMSRPRVTAALSHAFLTQVKDDSRNEIPTLRASLGVDLGIGLDVGFNARHDDGIDPDKLILRLVPEVKTYLVVPTSFVQKLVFSAGYAVRLPARKEVFRETRGLADGADPVPFADRRPRHHATAGITFKLTDWFGIEGEYAYGSLPPAFQMADHSGKIGLVFQAKQVRR